MLAENHAIQHRIDGRLRDMSATVEELAPEKSSSDPGQRLAFVMQLVQRSPGEAEDAVYARLQRGPAQRR